MYGTAALEASARAASRRGLAAVAGLLLVALVAAPVLAQTTIYVPGDYSTIQAAYATASAGDEIVVATGTYNEHDIVVTSGVSLRGATGDPGDVTVDAQNLGIVFSISGAAVGTSIEAITITNGVDNVTVPFGLCGGVYVSNSTLEMSDCILTGCSSTGTPGLGGNGGGIGADNSDLTLTDCDFVSNMANYEGLGGWGGAVYMNGGSLLATRCLFDTNTAGYQGGAVHSNADPEMFTDCTFTGNTAGNAGGGYYSESGNGDFVGCTFTLNTCLAADGGAVRGDVNSLTNCEFSYNTAGGTGGAMGGVFAVVDTCDFFENSATFGGAVFLGGTGTFTGCTFHNNEATAGSGGAVWNVLNANYSFVNCTFSENSATGSGGALCADHTSQAWLDKCIVAFSSAGEGVACLDTGVATLTCTDVYGNAGGDWVGCILGQQGNDFNMNVDPLFCGVDNPTEPYSLRSDSPCAAPNNLDCGQVGAKGVGCVAPTISQANSSWEWNVASLESDGGATVCPAGDGASYIEIYIRDGDNLPVEGAAISLDLTGNPCPSINYCPTENVLTNSSGYAVVYPQVGLQAGFGPCCTVEATVGATYLDEDEVTILYEGTTSPDSRSWRSYDLNGNGVVNGSDTGGGWGDWAIFNADFGTSRCRSDFNASGSVNLIDYADFAGHVASSALKVSDGGVIDLGLVDEGTQHVRQLELVNWANGPSSWQLTESCPWLTISPSSGSLDGATQEPPQSGARVTADFTVNTTGLGPGPHDCLITVVGAGPNDCFTNNPVVVSMNVLPASQYIDWNAEGDGMTWEDPDNWDLDRVPGANDHARVQRDGNYTIFYNSNSGIYALTHGAMNGVQTLDIQSGSLGLTDGGTNAQKIVLRDDATLDVSAGGDTALVVNDATGTFVLDNGDLVGSGKFTNRGHFRKTGNLISHITMDFENEVPGRAELPLVSVEAGTLSFEGETEINGRMVVNSGGTAITSGTLRVIDSEVTVEAGGGFVVGAGDTVLVTSTGSLDVSGDLTIEPGGVLLNQGDVSINAGGALTVDGEFDNQADGQLVGDGLVYVPTGGVLTNDGYFDLGENGILTGGGTVDNTVGEAVIKGLVAPGDAEGTLTFLGDFVQSPTSEISLEIGGYDQGTSFDYLDVSGLATLDGAVAVTLTNGFEPVVGDTFQTITHAGAGPGGTSFYCYSGLDVSGTVYLDPLHLTGEFVLTAVSGTTGNQSPVAVDDDASVTGYQPITIDVLANDSDPDLDDLRVILLNTETLSGIAYINEDDLLVSYAALPGHAGADSFDYVVTDCYGGADIGRVRINVTAPPQMLSVPDDVPTIAGALALASSGDTVVLEAGTYYESGLTIPPGVTMTGETGEPDGVIIDATGLADRVLHVVDADGTTAIVGITVTGGGGVALGGGLYCERATPTVIDCVFDGNAATSGGGVACSEGSNATFIGCRISGNSSTDGGGVYCTGGSSASFSQCTFDANVATGAGGAVRCDSLSSPMFESCTFAGNEAPLSGGSGLSAGDGTSPTLDLSIVASGVTGEAVACEGTGTATFTCSDLYGNAGGDWTGCVSGQGSVDGNFSLDPNFCAAGSGDYHITAVSPCADAPGCGLVGALAAGCVSDPDIDVSPTSFTFDLSAGETATDSLLISDLGRPDLTWLVRESVAARGDGGRDSRPVKARVVADGAVAFREASPPVPHVEVDKGETDPRDGRGPARGSGGPDAFGYTWVDSDDPAGPSYSWREISGVGTALSLTDDDHEQVLLPFTFPFYSQLELLVSIGSNGYLTFDVDADDYSNDPIPDAWAPNNVIAPFWDDLNPEAGGTVYHYYDATEEEFIVQYDGVYDYYGAGPYTFEVVLKPDGSILFLYNDITGTPASATVGIEDAYGTTGLEVVFNSAYITSGLAVLIEDPAPWLVQSPRSGVVPGLGSGSVVLEVDTGGLAQGIYLVDLVIESDDPDEPEVTIPVTLTIDDVGIDDEISGRYVLYGNYPNPFNPKTEISYELPAPANVSLSIYSIAGRVVRELLDGERQAPGVHRIPWDGRDEGGRRVASGVYYYRLEADGKVLTNQMVLIK